MSFKENFSDIFVYVIFGLVLLALILVAWKIMGGCECSTIPKMKKSKLKITNNPINTEV